MTRRTSRLRPSRRLTLSQVLLSARLSTAASIGPYFTPSTTSPSDNPASERSGTTPCTRTR